MKTKPSRLFIDGYMTSDRVMMVQKRDAKESIDIFIDGYMTGDSSMIVQKD